MRCRAGLWVTDSSSWALPRGFSVTGGSPRPQLVALQPPGSSSVARLLASARPPALPGEAGRPQPWCTHLVPRLCWAAAATPGWGLQATGPRPGAGTGRSLGSHWALRAGLRRPQELPPAAPWVCKPGFFTPWQLRRPPRPVSRGRWCSPPCLSLRSGL